MSRSSHARKSLKHELTRPGGGYMARGRFAKTVTHRIARREPLPALEEYSWPTPEELSFFDEDDELRAAADAAEFELLWSDGWIYQRYEDHADDYGLCSCRDCRPALTLAEIEDYREELSSYDRRYEDRW
jgi:hypothetical protein